MGCVRIFKIVEGGMIFFMHIMDLGMCVCVCMHMCLGVCFDFNQFAIAPTFRE